MKSIRSRKLRKALCVGLKIGSQAVWGGRCVILDGCQKKLVSRNLCDNGSFPGLKEGVALYWSRRTRFAWQNDKKVEVSPGA